jgi:hypothetical protein
MIGVILVWGLSAGQLLADDPPKLSYAFQKDREYLYRVKIVADLPDETRTHDGVYTYKVTDAADTQCTLQVFGNLGQRVQYKPDASRGFGPPMLPPFPRHFGPRFGEPMLPPGTTIGRQGNLITQGNVHALPLLLGSAEMLIVEPLPNEAKAAWDTQTGLGVVEQNESRHRFGPFGGTEVAHGATEKINFNVQETTPETVKIGKTYSLETAPEAGKGSRISMSGHGDFEFDRKKGVIKSQSMDYEIKVNENNVSVTVPVKLNFHLLTDEEVAAEKKRVADAAAAAAEAARPKPLTASERPELLRDLQSGDNMRIQRAADRLAKGIRDDHPEAISRALCRAMKGADEWTQPKLLGALKVWATPDAEATIVAAAKQSNIFVSGPALDAIKSFKSQAAAEAAGAALPNMQVRGNASAALKAMGRVAEPYVIPYVDSQDFFLKKEAWGILKEIGGKKSIRALKSELSKAAWHEKDELQQTIGAIESRADDNTVDAAQPATASSKTAVDAADSDEPEQKSRKWHDATGTYSVDAAFVHFGDGKVTLKKTDGKTITIPLAKLSDDDQDFVRKQPKAVNPFE